MATYKVIQDIEAEDKILGPLTLRQFIYALITCFFLYLCFIVVTKHAAFLLILFLPPAIFTGFFAAPFGRDQPTEVWAVAKIGFLFKPRKRIWDQSGIKELVTITVPKKIQRVYTNGLSQAEVTSRLSALANTIDSRGWAIKNINVNLYAQPAMIDTEVSDRLVGMSSMPQPVADYDVKASDDMLDELSNPIAQQFTQMISASANAHREELIASMNNPNLAVPVTAQPPSGADMWFTGNSAASQTEKSSIPFTPQVVSQSAGNSPQAPEPAQPTMDEEALLEHIKEETSSNNVYSSHMKTIQPLSSQPPAFHVAEGPEEPLPVQPPPVANPVIQNLARSNDLNIATLAREAQKSQLANDSQDGEVVISLR